MACICNVIHICLFRCTNKIMCAILVVTWVVLVTYIWYIHAFIYTYPCGTLIKIINIPVRYSIYGIYVKCGQQICFWLIKMHEGRETPEMCTLFAQYWERYCLPAHLQDCTIFFIEVNDVNNEFLKKIKVLLPYPISSCLKVTHVLFSISFVLYSHIWLQLHTSSFQFIVIFGFS